MIYNFIYYTTDGSFDYDAPWGTETHHVEDWHGFSIEINDDNQVLIDTLEGYGDFAVEISEIKTLAQLKAFILGNMKEIRDTGNLPEECYMELVSFIDEMEDKNDN